MKSLFVVTALLRAGIEKQKIFTSCRATLKFIADTVKALVVSSVTQVSDGKERIREVLTYLLIRRPFGERAVSDSCICTKLQLSPDVLDSCGHR
jgi:hypothetical protein